VSMRCTNAKKTVQWNCALSTKPDATESATLAKIALAAQ